MLHQPNQDMHYQAGIDWVKAARTAMASKPETPKKSGIVRTSNSRSQYNSATLHLREPRPQTPQLVCRASIKYPATVGHRRKRVPTRDSFLRGGTQFKNFQHSSKAGFGEIDVAENYDQASLPQRILDTLKRTVSQIRAYKKTRPQPGSQTRSADDFESIRRPFPFENSVEFSLRGSRISKSTPHSRPCASSLFSASRALEKPCEIIGDFESRQPIIPGAIIDSENTASSSPPTYHSRYELRDPGMGTDTSRHASCHYLSSACAETTAAAVRPDVAQAISKDAPQSCIDHDSDPPARSPISTEHEYSPSQERKAHRNKVSKKNYRRRTNGPGFSGADESHVGSIRKLYRRTKSVRPFRYPPLERCSGRVNLYSGLDELPLTVMHPGSELFVARSSRCDDLEAGQNGEVQDDLQVVNHVSRNVKETLGASTSDIVSRRPARVTSAAERDFTLNYWSSDESADDQKALQVEQKFRLKSVSDASPLSDEPVRVSQSEQIPGSERLALADIDVNTQGHARFQASITSLDHRDAHLAKPDLANHSGRMMAEGDGRPTAAIVATASLANTGNSYAHIKRASIKRGRSSLSKVRSAIQGFEDKILENRARAERRTSYHSTSLSLRTSCKLQESDRGVQSG